VPDADIILPTEPTQQLPVVRSIGLLDLRDALVKGLDHFRAMPTHVVFLSLIYPIVGIALGSATFGYDLVLSANLNLAQIQRFEITPPYLLRSWKKHSSIQKASPKSALSWPTGYFADGIAWSAKYRQ
jgi:hypothetical protein